MFYRRKLPHWQPELDEEDFLFATWRLAGSAPRVRPAEQAGRPRLSAGRAFVTMDREIDKAAFGPVWLKDPRIARVVAYTLRAGDGERRFYLLRSWVIMPNHVHVLLRPHKPLSVVMRWLKGSTARQANRILERTGEAFWQDESFDHRVRDEVELERVVRYIEENPVSAGLVRTAREWAWSSAGRQTE